MIPIVHFPGEGPWPPPILIVGEAPGHKETAEGRPFVGPSGQELNRYLLAAGINRDDCYVTNICKYQPPCINGKQQAPTAEDIARDEPELLAELELVQPRIICTVGRHATRYFLPAAEMQVVSRVPHHWQWQWQWQASTVILPVFHPAGGMHKPEDQPKIYKDFLALGRLARGEISATPIVPFSGTSTLLLDEGDGPEILS